MGRFSSKGFVLLVGGVVLYQSDSTKTREISLDKDYYLMDEITDALDDVHFKQVMDALCKLANEKLVILATHDKRTLSYGTRLILKEGKLFQE